MSEEISDELICPHCGEAVNRPADVMQNVILCPHCGEQFFIEIAPPDEADDEAERVAAQLELDRARDLDGLRIRSLSAERRAIYRTRTYLILGLAGSVFGVGLIASKLMHGHYNFIGWISMILLAIGCAMGVPFFWKKIVVLQKEINQPRLAEPDQPPEFESLSDGSQTWKQLEEMHRPAEED